MWVSIVLMVLSILVMVMVACNLTVLFFRWIVIVACPMICMGEWSAVVRVSSSPGSVIAVFSVSGISLYACK